MANHCPELRRLHTFNEHRDNFYVFMALLRVSRLRVSADPQVLNLPEDRLKLLAVKLGVVP